MNLCTSCQGFDIQSFSRQPNGVRGYKLQTVKAEAESGCKFCNFVYRNVEKYVPAQNSDLWVWLKVSEDGLVNRDRPHQQKKRSNNGVQRINRLHLELSPLPYEFYTQTGKFWPSSDWPIQIKDADFCISAEPGSPASKEGNIIGQYIGPDPASDAHFSLISHWINDCVTSHPNCSRSISGTAHINCKNAPLPRRCLEIGTKTLVLRETEGMRGMYATLSHRWNDETESSKTTRGNYHDRLNGRGLQSLPKIFRDAVDFATKLGVKYLWIDSICIIQDDIGGMDWTREALKMAQYYEHSLVTVCSTWQPHGLFNLRSPKIVPENILRLPYRDSEGTQKGFLYVYKRSMPFDADYKAVFRYSPLFSRAWVFQEWLLSRRIICYTPTGIYFECQTKAPINEFLESFRQIDKPRLQDRLEQLLCAKFSATLVSETDIQRFWYQIVQSYSHLDLTKPENDRILAISGIAKEFRHALAVQGRKEGGNQRFKTAYASGLWVGDLHHGFLWEHSARNKVLQKFKCACKAPSWSWASLMVPVRWQERGRYTMNACHILGLIDSAGVESPLIGPQDQTQTREADEENPTGTNCTGFAFSATEHPSYDVSNVFTLLHIQGRIMQLLMRGEIQTDEILEVSKATAANALNIWSWRAICLPSMPEYVGGWGSFERFAGMAPEAISNRGRLVHALHISTQREPRGPQFGYLSRWHDVYNVLFIEHVDGNRYRRIGVGRIFDKDVITVFNKAPSVDLELE